MTLAGPQIGGVSLIAHIFIIGAFGAKKFINKVSSKSNRLYRKNSHPYRPNAK